MQKTVPSLIIAFSNWYGFLWPPRKISGCVSLAPENTFFIRVPPLNYLNFLSPKGGPSWRKCFLGAKETHPDILNGGHRDPYQLKNATKSGGTVFRIYHPCLPGSCVHPKSCQYPLINYLNLNCLYVSSIFNNSSIVFLINWQSSLCILNSLLWQERPQYLIDLHLVQFFNSPRKNKSSYKGVFFNPSGKCIVVPNFCFLS